MVASVFIMFFLMSYIISCHHKIFLPNHNPWKNFQMMSWDFFPDMFAQTWPTGKSGWKNIHGKKMRYNRCFKGRKLSSNGLFWFCDRWSDFCLPPGGQYIPGIQRGMYCQLGDYILLTTLYKNLKNPLISSIITWGWKGQDATQIISASQDVTPYNSG